MVVERLSRRDLGALSDLGDIGDIGAYIPSRANGTPPRSGGVAWTKFTPTTSKGRMFTSVLGKVKRCGDVDSCGRAS